MVELRGRERKERRIEQSRSSLEYEDLKVNPVHTCSCHEQTVFPTSFAFDLIGRDRGQLKVPARVCMCAAVHLPPSDQ